MFFVKFGEKHLIDVSLFRSFFIAHDTLYATERGTNEVRKFELTYTEEDKEKAFTRFTECVMLLNSNKEDD